MIVEVYEGIYIRSTAGSSDALRMRPIGNLDGRSKELEACFHVIKA